MFGSSSPEQQLNNIHLLIHQGKLAEAQQRLTQFNKENPRNPVGFFLAALLTEDRAQKISLCDHALNIDPDFGPARELFNNLRSTPAASHDTLPPLPEYRQTPLQSFFSNLSLEAGVAIAAVAFGLLVLVIIGLTNFVTSSKPGAVASIPTTAPRVIYVSSTPAANLRPSPTILPPPPVDTPGNPAEIQIEALSGTLHQTDFHIVDAKYSRSMDRIVAISDSPSSMLHIYDPETNNDVTVPLSRPGISLSVSPDGKFAAVGQDAAVTYIDLQQAAIVKTLKTTTTATQIVLDANGWAYIFPPGNNLMPLHAVQLSSNKEITLNQQAYGGDRIIRANDGTGLYLVTRNARGELPRYVPRADGDLSMESPHTQHCEDTWLFAEVQSMHMGCDTVISTYGSPKEAFGYSSVISKGIHFFGSAYSASAKKLVAIVVPRSDAIGYPFQGNESFSPYIYMFDDYSLARTNIFTLPTFADGTPSGGNFIFTSNDGTRFYVLVQDFNRLSFTSPMEATSGDRRFGIVAADVDPRHPRLRITPSVSPTHPAAVSTQNTVIAASPTAVVPTATPTVTIVPSLGSALSAQSKLVQLDYPVVGAAFSQSLNRLVLISDDPPAVHVYNPADGSDNSFPLPRAPLSVDVSRDGLTAAVGQDQRITTVDIKAAKLIKNYDVQIAVTNMAIANNGWIYAVTRGYQIDGIFGLNLQTGDMLRVGDMKNYDYGSLTLTQDGKGLYYATQRVSYPALHYFKIAENGFLSADLLSNTDDRKQCARVWISLDGQRLINACGATLNVPADDSKGVTYTGTLNQNLYNYPNGPAYDALAQVNKIFLAFPHTNPPVGSADNKKAKLLVFDYDTLQNVATIDLPTVPFRGKMVDGTFGSDIFVNAQGDTFYAIVHNTSYVDQNYVGIWSGPVPSAK